MRLPHRLSADADGTAVIEPQHESVTPRRVAQPADREPVSDDEEETWHFRALFLSDVHLGARGCQADRLLDFLRVHEADTIYLVGDIVDGWALRASWYWPQPHNDVVQKLLRKARKGARLVYIPGNHDEFL